MTDEMMNLRALVERPRRRHFARDDRLRCRAADGTGGRRPDRRAIYGERAGRLAQRNGYRDRTWETRAGAVELRIPKAAQGAISGLLEPRRMAEKALTAVIQETLHPRCLDPLGRRSGQGDGHERRVSKSR